MFIVKAEVSSHSGPNFQLFQAEAVNVRRSSLNGVNSDRPFVAPDMEVELTDIDGRPGKILYVGYGQDHYSTVYIMNAQGKTVDSVYPGPRSIGGGVSIAA